MTGTYPSGIKPKGYQQITVSNTAISLSVPAGVTRAKLFVEAQPIRWRDDDTAPTATVGVLAKADTVIELYGTISINQFQAIKDDTTDATLNVVYYGE